MGSFCLDEVTSPVGGEVVDLVGVNTRVDSCLHLSCWKEQFENMWRFKHKLYLERGLA